MGIAKRDGRLEEQMGESADRADKLTLTGRSAQLRDLAVEELREQHQLFKPVIKDEDTKEIERDNMIARVNETREQANLHFGSLHGALVAGVSIGVAAAGGQADKKTREVEAYIAGFTPADFKSLARKDALSHFERTLGYADKFVPAALQPEVIPQAQAAYDAFEASRDALGGADTTWNQAQAKLVDARAAALAAYNTFRDHMSGILRTAGMHDRLNQIVPPASTVFYGQSGGSESDEPTEPAEPVVEA